MTKRKNGGKLLATLLAACLIPVATGAAILMMEDDRQKTGMEGEDGFDTEESFAFDGLAGDAAGAKARPVVSVESVEVGTWQAVVRANGVAEPKFNMVVVSEVGGRIVKLAPDLVEGRHIREGTPLVRIDPTERQKLLADARQSLAAAKLAYLQEERQARQAVRDWKRVNGEKEPASSLVLREPQRKAAHARYEAAKKNVALAAANLAKTEIKAPFNAVVMNREVSPGQYLSAGAAVARLYAKDASKIRISLSEEKWKLLNVADRQALKTGVNNGLHPVLVNPLEPGSHWQAQTVRLSAARDGKTRQRILILDVETSDAGAQPPLAGTFLQARLQGHRFDGILDVPASAVSASGYLWTVSEDGMLNRHKTAPIAYQAGRAIVKAPGAKADWQVVVNPLSSYLPGIYVDMRPVGGKGPVRESVETAELENGQ